MVEAAPRLSRISVVALLSVAFLSPAACTAPQGMTSDGTIAEATDARYGVSLVKWRDGEPANAISCGMPGGCQSRALSLCSLGQYRVLESNNMPSVGTWREELGPPSIVVRCGA
jgi:hypothetical protein